MYNLVVFASGNGTTLQSIIDAIENKVLNARVNLVVTNNENAYAIERAKKAGIETYIIKNKDYKEADIELVKKLSAYDINLIVLAGYLKMIGENLIKSYTIINTHPSLLPKYGGKGMYGMNVHRAVIDAKEEYSGVTLHYVNDKYDEGNIIRQTKVKIEPGDTADTLSSKVQKAEKIQLIEVLKELSKD